MYNAEPLVLLIISTTTDLIWIWTSDLEAKENSFEKERKVEQSHAELKYPLGNQIN